MKKKQKVDYNAPAVFNPESQSITQHLGFPGCNDEGKPDRWEEFCDLLRKSYDDSENDEADILLSVLKAIKHQFMGINEPITVGEIVMGLAAFKTGEMVGQAKTIDEIQSKLGSFGGSLLSKILGDMFQCPKCRARMSEDAEDAPCGDRKAVEVADFDEAVIPNHNADDVYAAFGLEEHDTYDMGKLLNKFCSKISRKSELLYSMMNAVGRRANPDFDATKRDALMVLLGCFIGCSEYSSPKVSIMGMPDCSLPEEVKDALLELIGK